MRIGFLLNPIAGLGGTVALKGTDGLSKEAIRLGAKPVSPMRATMFFEVLEKNCSSELKNKFLFSVPKDPMGEQIIKKYAFKYKIIDIPVQPAQTTSQDTKKSIEIFENEQVDIILFVGGDGTSVDIGTSIRNKTPLLGIPSGVKTYGSVFAHTPEEAVTVLLSFQSSKRIAKAELLDLDESLYKKGIISISLKGIVSVPAFPEYFQDAKERVESTESEEDNLSRIADEILSVITETPTKKLLIVGPGSTFSPLGKKFGISRSILGVDCIEFDGNQLFRMVLSDAREDQIFNLLAQYKSIYLLITPIGGMGYILGRGNHQISPRIVKMIPKEQVLICSTNRKLKTIKDGILRIDTTDEAFNISMSGYIKVIIDIDQRRMLKVMH